jgi:hypothetical protein
LGGREAGNQGSRVDGLDETPDFLKNLPDSGWQASIGFAWN